IIGRVQQETADFLEKARSCNPEERTKLLQKIGQSFKECLKHGEDKVALAVQTYDMVDRHIRRLDDDLAKFEEEQMTGPKLLSSSTHAAKDDGSKAARLERKHDPKVGEKRGSGHAQDTSNKKQKTNKSVKQTEKQPETPSTNGGSTPRNKDKGKITNSVTSKQVKNAKKKDEKKSAISNDLPIDPNEPTYCVCRQVSYGEMIERLFQPLPTSKHSRNSSILSPSTFITMSATINTEFVWPESFPQKVVVTGSFDSWSQSLEAKLDGSVFRAHIELPVGEEIVFKFVVDGVWKVASNYETVSDESGNVNNVLTVSAPSESVAQAKETTPEAELETQKVEEPVVADVETPAADSVTKETATTEALDTPSEATAVPKAEEVPVETKDVAKAENVTKPETPEKPADEITPNDTPLPPAPITDVPSDTSLETAVNADVTEADVKGKKLDQPRSSENLQEFTLVYQDGQVKRLSTEKGKGKVSLEDNVGSPSEDSTSHPPAASKKVKKRTSFLSLRGSQRNKNQQSLGRSASTKVPATAESATDVASASGSSEDAPQKKRSKKGFWKKFKEIFVR
ncbi:Inhibitor of growth protein 4, partial [Quaeritorhiza haematococci]